MKKFAVVLSLVAVVSAAMFAVGRHGLPTANAAPAQIQETLPPPAAVPAAQVPQVPGATLPLTAPTALPDHPAFYTGAAAFNASERAGREIWYKATAGNARFHSYTFQQRIGVLIDWYRVLNANERADRFRAWGVINDPGCCVPGSQGCPAQSLEETYGFEYCPGDDELLKYVGKGGYRDPACDFGDAPVDTSDPHFKHTDQRQSSCDLAFGTSTGALGFRKFPNPRFDQERWLKLNGNLASWDGYRKKLTADPRNSDSSVSRLADGSIEPPFLIGTSCGACHVAFDPLNPPDDPANPQWANIKGTVGNQYTRISEILGSGMAASTLEFQVFAHARPGTSDTSAIPTDQVNNPGTINALIHTDQRPTFPGEEISKWRKVSVCMKGDAENACWCEPGRDGKCWQWSTQTATATHHILKGGEDSIGALEAIQRVYFNIGSCSEQCWVNHLSDLRQLDPSARGFGQTPFRIGQCRRDCPNFRAIEDRLSNIFDFLRSAETNTTDLDTARENEKKKQDSTARYTYDDLVADLDKEFGANAVARGRELFANSCARCHSSIPEAAGGPFGNRDFRTLDPKTHLRADWMGNDVATPVSEVGTFRCRALHSNHLAGHVWHEYASETLRARVPDPNVREPSDGGRGYYRNISLLSLWAHAPFMHNNAMGPELCGKPANQHNEFYRSPYVGADQKLLAPDQAPACWEFDTSVAGRFKLFKTSMEALLNPRERIAKITKFDVDVPIALGPRLWDGDEEKQVLGFTLTLPAGTNAGALGNFQFKQFVGDLVMLKFEPASVESKLVSQLGAEKGGSIFATLKALGAEVVDDPKRMLEAVKKHPQLIDIYSSCTAEVENDGHRFGEGLSAEDKRALIAFLATI